MRRFHVAPHDIHEGIATLTGSEAHHLTHVLRLKPGTRITLFDGTGSTYEGNITRLVHDKVTVNIDRINSDHGDHPQLHLGQALITGKKFDLVVQKATELGIASLTPYLSTYCAKGEPSAHKQERWERIALESCKQCCRTIPPKILPVMTIKECFKQATRQDLKIIFWEETASHNLKDVAVLINEVRPHSIFYMIGPEGGLTDTEVLTAQEHGFVSVTLGQQILRAETAGIAAGAILQFLLGNMD
ncbi:MAG: 16S rRNA (uracil(1498)-N(3))-methyltransferase [Proteobacteria bacterium]|nr:16S rRNA (uracil(1498)-N(3))-methyltransferase [Pseudomonadota bacterium]MBU1685735.1 16S rRNA (uracil(1498)-N(3))-methyltransferase [Pseudomonadota bacterium]